MALDHDAYLVDHERPVNAEGVVCYVLRGATRWGDRLDIAKRRGVIPSDGMEFLPAVALPESVI